ncbi:rab-GTPase-TBC domain-containing protein [Phycomyces blakesleeanus]|uniref:Rab-GTPase-TBC domain-containing protein n=1 Tax=Phycomyces blakesleeanus TaxID=4837 RepID=A0ABR3AVD5_PHYBL
MLQLSPCSTAVSRVQRQRDRSASTLMEQDEAISVFNDFTDILQSEVHVDLERLRILARHGVPNQLRGEVWMYLLGVQDADRSKELTRSRARSQEYDQLEKGDPDLLRRIRAEVGRYQRRTSEMADQQYLPRFENIITAYLNTNRDVDYHPALIYLCAPFLYALDRECDAYFCFERLMQAIDEVNTTNTTKQRVAHFLSLFRYALPELCNYFEDEEVNLDEWSTSWLQNLLSKELPFSNLVALWDAYFAVSDPLEFHPFVCLAILCNAKDNLEDLEQSEIRTMLLCLPVMDMKRILADASNLHHETMERMLFEEEHL